MATTIDARTDPRVNLDDVQQWVREHGYAPEDLRPTVTVNGDTSVLLERIKRDLLGRPIVSGDEVLTELVTVHPLRRPFPMEDR